VRHIVLTHLDLDHAGGLPDFPEAEVHLLGREYEAGIGPNRKKRDGYVTTHWAHGPKWVEHEVDGDEWLGFESIRVLPGSGGEVLLIPLIGHTHGHTGVAIRRPDGWLLHCGDAYFDRHEVETPPSCPPAMRVFQRLMQEDGPARQQNQERLRELAQRHADEVELICSHDGATLDRYQAAAAH
jgi:glyoxylase-like metal-dependent hydrolase (beta-lactamase superfamily II)